MSIAAEREVIGRDARLQRCEDERLPLAVDLEDGAAAIADVEIFVLVERKSGSNTHALDIGGHVPVRRDFINRTLVTRGDVHLSSAVECDRGCVHQISEKGSSRIVRADLVHGHGNLLSAWAGKSGEDVAVGIYRG